MARRSAGVILPGDVRKVSTNFCILAGYTVLLSPLSFRSGKTPQNTTANPTKKIAQRDLKGKKKLIDNLGSEGKGKRVDLACVGEEQFWRESWIDGKKKAGSQNPALP